MYPEFKNCLYLDDRLENTEACKKFNFRTIQFILDKISSTEELQNKLKEIKTLI